MAKKTEKAGNNTKPEVKRGSKQGEPKKSAKEKKTAEIVQTTKDAASPDNKAPRVKAVKEEPVAAPPKRRGRPPKNAGSVNAAISTAKITKTGKKSSAKTVKAEEIKVEAKKVETGKQEKPVMLVTGACGFAGGYMTDLLIQKGFDVVATDLESAKRDFLNPAATFIPADITNYDSSKRLFEGRNIEKVFHPAAIFDYEAPWDLCERVNVGGMRNMCRLSLEHGVKRFVLFSTVSVYGSPRPEDLPVKETTARNPGTNYEKSKVMQEDVGMEYNAKGLPVSIIRPAPVYGPRNFYGFATILFLMAKFPLMPFPTNMEGNIVGVNVRDVCNAAYFISTKEEAIGEAYNIIDDSQYTIGEFVEFAAPMIDVKLLKIKAPQELVFQLGYGFAELTGMIAKAMGTRPFLEKDMVYYLKAVYGFSNDKIKALGYELLYPDMKSGLVETIDWYKAHGHLDRKELWHKALFSKTK